MTHELLVELAAEAVERVLAPAGLAEPGDTESARAWVAVAVAVLAGPAFDSGTDQALGIRARAAVDLLTAR